MKIALFVNIAEKQCFVYFRNVDILINLEIVNEMV